MSPLIIMLLGKQAGIDVTTPSGAAILRHDIESRTGECLSLNTIKRIVGVLDSDNIPRISTRDIIARYLGYSDWKQLNYALNPPSSAFYKTKPYIDAREEPVGMILCILWEPHHGVKIQHLGEGRYQVIHSLNSKLHKDDILTLSFLAKNYPMIVSNVARGSENLGCYIAGIDSGLVSLRRSKRINKP